MSTTRKTTGAKNGSRDHELKKILEGRRRELLQEVHGRIRGARTHVSNERQVLDEAESSEVDSQEDIEFALIQMQAEALNKIDAALGRLNEGAYGLCFECGAEIAEQRLRALLFAVRCRECEEVRETVEQRDRIMTRVRSSSFVAEMFH
jgi:DnaK suppressor protein